MIWVHAVQLHKHKPSVTGFIFRYVYCIWRKRQRRMVLSLFFVPTERIECKPYVQKKWANIKYILKSNSFVLCKSF